MTSISSADKRALITAIALREGTAKQLSKRFGVSVDYLRDFLAENEAEITATKLAYPVSKENELTNSDPDPNQLDDLWLTNKFERLKRMQLVADELYSDISTGDLTGADLATAVREFRSYLMLAANELGQLLHRGAGDGGSGDVLNVDIQGIDMEALR